MKKIIFLLIFVVALFFRFYKITQVPLSLNWDETAFGYNAYSVIQTGKDEYGTKLPLEFKSVGDYKCPLFVYFLVPVIKIFGLNEFSIRLLPSLFGAMSVVLFSLLVNDLFGNISLSILSGMLLAISPWHLQFTRAQGDVALGSFFVILGLWSFNKWLKGGRWQIYLSSFSFSLALYSYFSERLFVPVLLLAIAAIYQKEIKKRLKPTIKAFLLGFLLCLPLVFSMLSSGQKGKILMTTIFGYQRPDEYLQKMKREDIFSGIFNLYHNQLVEYGLMVIDHYFNQFSPSFLFVKGPPDDRQKIYGMGMMFWSDVILLVVGMANIWLIKSKKKETALLFSWLAVAPLPAVITRDPVHARRAFEMVYPLMVILALGILGINKWYSRCKSKFRIIPIAVFLTIFFWSFGYYLLSYYLLTPLRTYQGPSGWQYGYKQLVEFVSPLKDKYNQVVIDTTYQGPYLFFLFYEKYDPAKYQPQAFLVKKDEWSLGEGRGYDNYQFRDIYWPRDRSLPKTLFAGPPERISKKDIDPKQSELLTTIYFPDGKEAFYVVATK
ncbi:MAG: hypothetical protein BWY24_00470 [Microgenomates group bacterium ADurb.Bin219]|nr:MAG: hypothetical protein BWY24_00470 [Microgenomates group bacterium ADurb.Bin219]